MQTRIMKSVWESMDPTRLETHLKLIRSAGYDGVECSPPDMEPQAWKDLLARFELDYVAVISADTQDEFAAQARRAKDYEPLLINSRSGVDHMKFKEGCAFFLKAAQIEAEIGIPVAHETRRRRIFYSPWSTIPYLEEISSLKLSANFSQWCVVCESMMEDMEELMHEACTRAIHIHACIGYEEGPQVPDPRAPEYAGHVERHMKWWDLIRKERRGEGVSILTVTPEFGPPPYMHTLPYTNQPVAGLWDISLWMSYRLRERWGP